MADETKKVERPAGYNPAFATQKKYKWKVGAGGSYSSDAVAMKAAKEAPKVPTTVNNVNLEEVRHNTVTHTGQEVKKFSQN